ncbi:MAG: hypothetical protein U9Q80_02905 [Bacillota bacterium]|nr:hypothetical protein [Bacillota bacterium]
MKKNLIKRRIIIAVLSVAVGLSGFSMFYVNSISYANEISLELIDAQKVFYDGDAIITVTESTEENFINSLAEKENISYKDAEILNSFNLSENDGVVTRSMDEAIGYKQLESESPIDDSEISTVIAVEVQYLYNVVTGDAIEILNLGNPYIRIAGDIVSEKWDGSDPNVSHTSSTGRISYTGSAYVEVQNGLEVGLGIAGWTFGGSTSTTTFYWSPVVTQVMSIYLYQWDQ